MQTKWKIKTGSIRFQFFSFLGGLLLMPVLAVTGAPLLASWPNAAVGLYMALVPMFAGYVLFGRGLARILPSTATTSVTSQDTP